MIGEAQSYGSSKRVSCSRWISPSGSHNALAGGSQKTGEELELWAWSGNPTVSLDWGFHFAAGTTPGGNLSLRLPLKS